MHKSRYVDLCFTDCIRHRLLGWKWRSPRTRIWSLSIKRAAAIALQNEVHACTPMPLPSIPHPWLHASCRSSLVACRRRSRIESACMPSHCMHVSHHNRMSHVACVLFAGVRMVLSSLECIVLTSTLRCRFSVTGTYVHARFGNHRFSYGLLCMLHDAEHVTLFVAKLGRLHHGKSYTQTRCNFKNIVMQVSRRDCKNMMHNSRIIVLALLLVNVFEWEHVPIDRAHGHACLHVGATHVQYGCIVINPSRLCTLIMNWCQVVNWSNVQHVRTFCNHCVHWALDWAMYSIAYVFIVLTNVLLAWL